MGKFMDLTGNRYGNWTVLGIANKNNGKKAWLCRCDCGKEREVLGTSLNSGKSTSCGCSRLQYFTDLVGMQIGNWYVRKLSDKRQHKHRLYECECVCGNICLVSGSALKNGRSKSCGCIKGQLISDFFENKIIGKRFNKLTVLRKIGTNGTNMILDCLCDCGNHKECMTRDLVRGSVISCGCVKSKHETIIQQWLIDHNIQFEREKKFIGCKMLKSLRFDFYLPQYNIAIEYDGEFHFEQYESIENDLYSQKLRDDIKTKYCHENDIVLLRIPYWEKDNIESILNDWLFLNDDEPKGLL